MKALAFNRHPAQPFSNPLSVTLFADSAITPSTRPVFLPDFSDKWIARLMPACRIGRLGKTIADRFADRYYDAVTLCLQLIPQQWYDDLKLGKSNGDITGLFDNALIVGNWLAPNPLNPFTIEVDSLSSSLQWNDIGFEEAIVQASQFATLKNGDIIMPCSLEVELPASEGTRLRASISSQTAFDFKLK